jgi:PIN domain nuclease of toxin-antitoxin system
VILLDTHVVIWLALIPKQVTRAAAAAISQAASRGEIPCISVITLYEVANAIRRGRIQPTASTRVFLNRMKSRFHVFPISDAIALCAAELTRPFPEDPMDRMIAATAIVEKCTLVTADTRIHSSGACKVIW